MPFETFSVSKIVLLRSKLTLDGDRVPKDIEHLPMDPSASRGGWYGADEPKAACETN